MPQYGPLGVNPERALTRTPPVPTSYLVIRLGTRAEEVPDGLSLDPDMLLAPDQLGDLRVEKVNIPSGVPRKKRKEHELRRARGEKKRPPRLTSREHSIKGVLDYARAQAIAEKDPAFAQILHDLNASPTLPWRQAQNLARLAFKKRDDGVREQKRLKRERENLLREARTLGLCEERVVAVLEQQGPAAVNELLRKEKRHRTLRREAVVLRCSPVVEEALATGDEERAQRILASARRLMERGQSLGKKAEVASAIERTDFEGAQKLLDQAQQDHNRAAFESNATTRINRLRETVRPQVRALFEALAGLEWNSKEFRLARHTFDTALKEAERKKRR